MSEVREYHPILAYYENLSKPNHFRKAADGEEKIPSTPEELMNLPEKYRKLDDGEMFLISAEELAGGVCLMYMSAFGRRILSNSTEWYMDGKDYLFKSFMN